MKKSLEERQREMRERMQQMREREAAAKKAAMTEAVAKKAVATKTRSRVAAVPADSETQDVAALGKRIAALEAENQRLRQQIALLSARSMAPSSSHTDSVKEQQHNFFKYSNVRRW